MMSVTNRGWKLFLSLTVIAAGSLKLQAEPTHDSEHRLGSPESGQRRVIGVKNQKCDICHARKNDDKMDLDRDLTSAGNDGWILGDELLTWQKHDHHFNAFAILRNKQSEQMAKLLGIVDENGESIVHRDRRCLSCHSSVPVEQMQAQGNLVDFDTLQDPRFTIGVSCEGCHGPAGKDAAGSLGWGPSHFNVGDDPADLKNSWRLLTALEKFEKFGYWDVRSPDTQARICLSCHLGSVSQKKIITHEMYAAGHPPLPSFELSQFVRQMPRHWRRFEEKPEEVREKYLTDVKTLDRAENPSEYKFTSEKLPGLKATVISSLVALQESMRLTADLTAQVPEPANLPELANFSCYACHHELVRESWRKSRRLTAAPGRPTLHEWPITLAKIIDTTLSPAGADSSILLESALVMKALNSQPFGERDELVQSARRLADASEKTIHRLLNQPLQATDARRLLREIAVHGSSTDYEYDTARALVWAFERTITQTDLLPTGETAGSSAVDTKQFSSYLPLNEFDGTLLLLLRTNRQDPTPVKLSPQLKPSTRVERDIDISQGLLRIAKYDPAKVREIFARLLQELDRP